MEGSSEVKKKKKSTGNHIQRYSRAEEITTVNVKRDKFNNYYQMLLSSIREEDVTDYILKFSKIGKTLRKCADICNFW